MPSVRRITPLLLANDLEETIEFYRTVLGFELLGTYPESEPTFCQLGSQDAHLMFDTAAAGTHDRKPNCTGQLYMYPEDIDVAWAELKDRVELVSELQVHPWGMQSFRFKDPNGYEIIFGLSTDHDHQQ